MKPFDDASGVGHWVEELPLTTAAIVNGSLLKLFNCWFAIFMVLAVFVLIKLLVAGALLFEIEEEDEVEEESLDRAAADDDDVFVELELWTPVLFAKLGRWAGGGMRLADTALPNVWNPVGVGRIT